jgi:hypothetical protein
MELPDDVLSIIREYSKPLTRPDWRRLNRLPMYVLYKEIMENKNKPRWNYSTVLMKFVINIQQGQTWSELFRYAQRYGMEECSQQYGIQINVLQNILI